MRVKIHGVIVSTNGKGIAGVTVTIYPTGPNDSVETTDPTGPDGAYEFKMVKVSSAYDISYTSSKTDPVTLSRLCDGKDQQINVVLYGKGQPRPATAMLETLQSAERLLFLTFDEKFNERHKERLTKLRDTDAFFSLNYPMDKTVDATGTRATLEYLKKRQEALKAEYRDFLRSR
jgi:hypothetical protein